MKINSTFLVIFFFLTSCAPSAPVASREACGKIVSVRGAVQIKASGSETWSVAKAGSELFPTSSVRTADASFGSLSLADGSILELGPSSYIEMERIELGAQKASGAFRLYQGKLHSQISKLKAERDFEFLTPSCVVGIRGTDFFLEAYSNQKSYVGVIEGTVEVKPIATAQSPGILLSANKEITVAPSSPLPSPVQLTEEKKAAFRLDLSAAGKGDSQGIFPSEEITNRIPRTGSAGAGKSLSKDPVMQKVLLFDETEYTGVVIQEDSESIQLKTEFGMRTIKRSDIKKISPVSK